MKFPHLEFPQTQEIYFDNGERRVIYGITHVENGKWTHIICDGSDGHNSSEIIVNPDRVLFIRIRKKNKHEGLNNPNTSKK